MDFKKMQQEVHENSAKHGFWDGHVSPHDAQREVVEKTYEVSHFHGKADVGPSSKPVRYPVYTPVLPHGGEERVVLLHGGEENRLVPTKLALIHSEVSEALECYRNGEMLEMVDTGDAKPHRLDADGKCVSAGKPVGLPSELADIVIRVMDLAEALGIDLEGAIERKHAYNVTRPHKHGGKRC